jgi:hypothetical protein
MSARAVAWIRHNAVVLSGAAAVALVLLQTAALRLSASESLVRIILPATIAVAPLTLWALRKHMGIWVIYVGLAANLAVILANGGLMPIRQSTVVEAIGAERAAEYEVGRWIAGSKDVLVDDGSGRATALGDAIIVRLGGGGFAASPGDVVVFAGLMLLIAELSWAWQRGARIDRRSREGTRASPPRAEGSAPTPR